MSRRVLVVACSARKTDPGFRQRGPAVLRDIPAERSLVDLYDGPAWRMVRKRYACGGELDDGTTVWALSARFGLVPSFKYASTYDERLETEEQARELAADWRGAPDRSLYFSNVVAGAELDEVLVFGGRLYGVAFEAYASAVEANHGQRIRWRKTTGGIGSQLGELAAYLREPERI